MTSELLRECVKCGKFEDEVKFSKHKTVCNICRTDDNKKRVGLVDGEKPLTFMED